MKIGKNKILLIFVFIFFLVTRLFKIADIPGSVYWDEASIGYNAYSIGTDLKDEWGQTLPLHFRAFGEFKLPVYIYSVVPFVKILGLNALAVRLPAVLYSLGTLFLIYLITKKITENEIIGIVSAFLFSISPWIFIFSRTGYEAGAGLFFFILAVYLFLLASKRKIFFLLGMTSLIGSMYSYTSFRIIAVVILPFVFYLYLKKDFRKKILMFLVSIILFVISLIPVARLYLYDAGFQRAQVFSLIPTLQRVYDLSGKPHLQLTYNRTEGVNWTSNILQMGKNYFSHFGWQFLISQGDKNPRSQVPGHGQIYILDILFVVLSFFYILKNKKLQYFLPIVLLLIAPIPAMITKESPHALRAILASAAYPMLASFGIYYLAGEFKKYSKYIISTALAGYLILFGFYYSDFVKNYNDKTGDAWQYQYKETFISQNSGVVSDQYGQPYIFALFYQKYSPTDFRKTVVYNSVSDWGFSLVSSFNGFEFKK